MLKVLSVFGTRPEAIKMAPVVKALEMYPERIMSRVCVTGQHRYMLDQVLALFDICPDYDLNVMQPDQSSVQIASKVMQNLEPILKAESPDLVLVQGDTTTVLAATLAAFYTRCKVGHVEAGLRTHDINHPFPEEANRQITGVLADFHFAPTSRARTNLLKEGIGADRIFVTGNTVIDALYMTANREYDPPSGPLHAVPWELPLILVTAHRRENFGDPFEQVCLALSDIARHYLGKLHIVFPVHPNPNIKKPALRILGNIPNITLTEPLDYLPLIYLMKHAKLILTDSGGIQEEAPSLGKPVLVLREITERPEAVEAGTVRMVGTNRDHIFNWTCKLLDDEIEYSKMAYAVNPYGDGHAAERIVNVILTQVATL